MNNKFNSGDTIKYTSPYDGRTANGVIKTVDFARFNHSAGYFIEWSDGSSDWITDDNLSLTTKNSLSREISHQFLM